AESLALAQRPNKKAPLLQGAFSFYDHKNSIYNAACNRLLANALRNAAKINSVSIRILFWLFLKRTGQEEKKPPGAGWFLVVKTKKHNQMLPNYFLINILV